MTDARDADYKKKSKYSWLNLFKNKPFAHQHKQVPYIITGIFGAPLECAAQCGTTTPSGLAVPDPVNRCFTEILARGLRVEGLFRLSGSVLEVDQLQHAFDQPPTYGKYLDLTGYDIHAITSLVKKYLRLLPDPVIPTAFQPQFIQLLETRQTRQDDRSLVLAWSKLIKDEFPTTHFHVLHYIVLVTSWIQHYRQFNRMNPEAMAVILAPICAGLEKSFGQLTDAPPHLPPSSTPSSSSSHVASSHKSALSTSASSPTSASSCSAHTSATNAATAAQSGSSWLPRRPFLHHWHSSSASAPTQEQVEQLMHKTGQWTTIWMLIIEHHDVLLDHWRQETSPSLVPGGFPMGQFTQSDDAVFWQHRHSIPHPSWSRSNIYIQDLPGAIDENADEKARKGDENEFDDEDENDIENDATMAHPGKRRAIGASPLSSSVVHADDPYPVVVIKRQQHRRPHLLGIAKDDEHIYMNTPSPPPLPIRDFHPHDLKPRKKPSFLLRRPKSIASLHPRFKTPVS
ncbi:Rho GTPase activation protein [Gongronella butleri]|nr:Rho GTPase activation protein [Gongronella butleri]